MTFFSKNVSFPGFFADMRGVVEGEEGRENWAIRKEKKSAIGRRHFLQLNRKGHMVKSITLDNLSTNILLAFLAFPSSFLLRTYVILWFSGFCTDWFIPLHTLRSLCSKMTGKCTARTYIQLPLIWQWGASNVYLLVLSSWKVNIAENPIAVLGL